jgi:hypothetical protein
MTLLPSASAVEAGARGQRCWRQGPGGANHGSGQLCLTGTEGWRAGSRQGLAILRRSGACHWSEWTCEPGIEVRSVRQLRVSVRLTKKPHRRGSSSSKRRWRLSRSSSATTIVDTLIASHIQMSAICPHVICESGIAESTKGLSFTAFWGIACDFGSMDPLVSTPRAVAPTPLPKSRTHCGEPDSRT